ncbi:GntR family transcriptional regulator [Paenibacillus sp. LMG 31456]|uniref:GntR family transcriptional regulator n=1 Tax=Paenibacillus foliorum TaxID=2654974 RepID=A0A972GS54_9BACL|nr:GntR family transcriptional regulator [Paenibacillus foliorum]NOU93198.1 GntR family transcriptional regulator [Paenibacillus foliorum]
MRKLTRSVMTEEIYNIIKEFILNHRLKPGDKINIDQLARELEVSNIPIRESLSRLIAEGLVTAVPYKGMFVMHMSVKELDDIFELRRTLELLALRKAAVIIEKEHILDMLKDWESVTFTQEQTLEEALLTLAKMNDDLHGMYLKHCGNDMLRQLVEQYIERIQRYLLVLHPDIQKDLLQIEWSEHLQVLSALSEGNVELAVERLEHHLNNSQSRTRRLFIEGHELLTSGIIT